MYRTITTTPDNRPRVSSYQREGRPAPRGQREREKERDFNYRRVNSQPDAPTGQITPVILPSFIAGREKSRSECGMTHGTLIWHRCFCSYCSPSSPLPASSPPRSHSSCSPARRLSPSVFPLSFHPWLSPTFAILRHPRPRVLHPPPFAPAIRFQVSFASPPPFLHPFSAASCHPLIGQANLPLAPFSRSSASAGKMKRLAFLRARRR